MWVKYAVSISFNWFGRLFVFCMFPMAYKRASQSCAQPT